MDKNKGKDLTQTHSVKLPVFRKYINNSDTTSLRDTVAFLSRLNKTNDLVTKTLLSPSVTKENENHYYTALIQTGYKHFLGYKKRKITPVNLQKILSWLESIELLTDSLYENKNYKELWAVSGSTLTITFEWLPYETCFEPQIVAFLEKICSWIDIVYQETPAVNLKVEIISVLESLISSQYIPVYSGTVHPVIFLFNNSNIDKDFTANYFNHRKAYKNVLRQEQINIDNTEFSFNIRTKDQKEAVGIFLKGYNIYENAKTAFEFILNNSEKYSLPMLFNQFLTTTLNPVFIDELLDKGYKLKKIPGTDLTHNKLRLFLLSGKKIYLQQACMAGIDYETVTDNLDLSGIPSGDIRTLLPMIIFNRIDEFSEWLKQENHLLTAIDHLAAIEPDTDFLELIIRQTYDYLELHIGPVTHQFLEKLSNYLKNNGYGNQAKSLKQNLKKLFPERKYLLTML